MPKRIIELVREKKAEFEADEVKREKNAQLAATALMQGRLSLAWRNYMMQFVEQDPQRPNEPLDPNQLARLLAADNTLGDVDLDRKRAYMFSNQICGGGSPATGTGLPFDAFVESIDINLPGGCLAEPAPAPAAGPNAASADGETPQ
jgi:hypothetical protein